MSKEYPTIDNIRCKVIDFTQSKITIDSFVWEYDHEINDFKPVTFKPAVIRRMSNDLVGLKNG